MFKPQWPNIANHVTALRFLFAVMFVWLFWLDTSLSRFFLIITTLAIPLSDIIDGFIARRQGFAQANKTGAVLDSMADDFCMIGMFICLLSAGILPLWFVLLVLWTRSSISLVRLLTLITGAPYAGPRFSTKAKGAGYWLGLIYLVSSFVFSKHLPFFVEPIVKQAIIHALALLTIIAAIDFTFFHRRTLGMLFTIKPQPVSDCRSLKNSKTDSQVI